MIETKTSAPPLVVFSHGIGGFHRFQIGPFSIDYFRGVEEALKRLGHRVCFPAVPATGTIVERAAALDAALAGIDAGEIHIIAHSMGGLDARHMIGHLDRRRRIRSLVTVGTPHRGTPLVDRLLNSGGPLSWIAKYFGRAGLEELTPRACARFNEQNPDREDVRYLSYAGARPAPEMPPWFRGWTRELQREQGDNDSQVPVASARWGEFLGVVRAAHTELVGWSFAPADPAIARPFDHVEFYVRIVNELMKADAHFQPAGA